MKVLQEQSFTLLLIQVESKKMSHKIKISHEVPKELFNISKFFNDYPYVLGHLVEKDYDYKEFYKQELKNADFSILDNSAFELGKSIPFEELMLAARYLKPTHLVLPDTVHNKQKTIDDTLLFWSKYRQELKVLNIEPIGVVQGNSFEELLQCIENYHYKDINFIAIPFDCISGTDYGVIRYQFLKWLIKTMSFENVSNLKIHFLGLQNPQELLLYSKEERSLIHSIDTSSPILHGFMGNKFNKWGCNDAKPKLKLADNLDIKITQEQMGIITNNVLQFKKYLNE